mgnify:CR=1 FL=1
MRKFKQISVLIMSAVMSLSNVMPVMAENVSNISEVYSSNEAAGTALAVGDSTVLSVSSIDTNAAISEVEWISSNTKVAVVLNGKVTAIAPGTATITAKYGKFTAECKVTVVGIPMNFADVPKGAWFYDSVNWAYENNIMTGFDNGKFGPADNIGRGQFATILYRLENEPYKQYRKIFPDVTSGTFYSVPTTWAYDAKIIGGYENGKFGPADPITREQLATMMYRYAKQQGYNTVKKASFSGYPDNKRVSSFAKESMEWAVGNGLIKGDQGKLNPQGTASRAVIATIVMRFDNTQKL